MSTTPAAVNVPRASGGALLLLCACFALSGTAALIYQTAWTRQFAIVFGTSELAVATVLAAYMGGLALGALLAGKFLPRVQRPVLAYALLELGIALGAMFVVPWLLAASDSVLIACFGGQDAPPDGGHAATTLFYLAGSFLALALPTTLMGATLPMLARYAVTDEARIGRRVGMLYAINTAGAVVGALLTAFALLPLLGLQHTIWFAAALNALVFLLAAALAARVSPPKPAKGYSDDPSAAAAPPALRFPTFTRTQGPGWVLPIMLFAGAVAFFQEVLWSRMLAHIVGSSVYAFGVMVASFLTGIALGAALGAALGRDRRRAAQTLAAMLIVAAAAAAAAYLILEHLLPEKTGVLQNIRHFGPVALPMNAFLAALLLLPMTLAIGSTYPLAVRVLARDAGDAAPASARVYAWNTVGAILGSLAAGFVLIPLLKYEGSIRAAVCASALLGIAALWVLVPLNRIYCACATLVALATCASFWPAPPMQLLKTSPLNVGADGRVLYYDIGRSASVVMLAQDGGFALRTNGLPEALVDGPGSVPRFSGEFWLSPLAVIARPQARDMLVVGFGGGVVIEGVPPSVQRIDVIELEPKVIEANRRIAALRRRDPLGDPRVHVIVNDARGALRLTNHRYDAIVSQPSHPWTAGASHLYTREFMQLAHDHLQPNGVFVQWMNVIFMDEDLLRSLTATLLNVYQNVRVYRPDPNTLVFLASDAPLELESQVALTGLPLRDAPGHYARFGINNAEDLVAALVLDTDGAKSMAVGAALITDDDNRIATSSVYEKGQGMNADTSGRALAGNDPLQNADSPIYRNLRSRLSFPYLARRNGVFILLDPSLADRVGRMGRILGNSPEGEYTRAFYFRMQQQRQHASEMLRLAIDQYPGDEPLRQEYLRDYFGDLATGQAPDTVAELAATLTGPSATVLAAARHVARSEWSEVVKDEAALAETSWSDTWYPEALDMRVNWRTRVSNPEQSRGFADEAISMIDRMSIMSPTLPLYAMRARAGFTTRRPAIVVESVSSYARLAAGMARAGLIKPEALRKDSASLRDMLTDALKLPGADAARVAEVRAEISRLTPGS
jgi:spermidine synthase